MNTKKVLPYLTAEEIRAARVENVRLELEQHSSPGADVGCDLIEQYAGVLPRMPRETLRVLDCGTASGIFPGRLVKRGFRGIAAVDIDDYRNGEAKHSGAITEFRIADLSSEPIPWPDNSFEIVTAWCVLPHLENLHQCIREVHRVLTNGGIFFISMPHIGSLLARKNFFRRGEIERYIEQNNHISLFPPAVFKKTVLRYFTLADTEYWVNRSKLAESRFGWLKCASVERAWSGKEKFRAWFGNEVLYVLKKETR